MHKLLLYTFFFCLTASVANRLYSQDIIHQKLVQPTLSDTSKVQKDSVNGVPQKDIYDVVSSIFSKKKKPQIYKKDTITSKPVYSLLPAIGYTLETETSIVLSGNITFRTDSTARISVISSTIGYTQNKQFTFPIESEVWTKDNKYEFLGDYRFYRYPQNTYGLGSDASIKNIDPMDYLYARFYQAIYRHVAGNLFAGGGYIIDYHTRITERGPTNGAPSDYQAYGANSSTISSGFTLNALYDGRDNPVNAHAGFYTALQYRSNYTALGSTYSWSSLIADVRKYVRFPEGSENVLAFWSYDWLVLSGHPPYLDLPATGWDPYSDTGRGYIQGRFRGAQEIYGEAEYRFGISANGLFGGVVFVNASSFSAAPGTRLQGIQPGYGPGLRIKINKISKTNVSIDYGFGREGSNGLFINVAELF